jgi:hypothetical protein
MSACCSLDIRNIRIRLDFVENDVSVDINGRMTTLKGEIGEAEMISRKISLILISAHHRMR